MTSPTAQPITAPPDYDEQRRRELLAAVLAARIAMHSANAGSLAAVLHDLGAGFNVGALRAAVDPRTNYRTRRARARDEIMRQLGVLGLTPRWEQVVRDAHTAAITGGVAAAAHWMSDGLVSPYPAAPTLPSSFSPARWIAQEHRGMGGDVAKVLAGDTADAVTDWDLAMIVEAGAGAQYYLDVQASQAFLDGTEAQYDAFGYSWVRWITMGDERVCDTCESYRIQSPYRLRMVPWDPHALCRCWLEPTTGPDG